MPLSAKVNPCAPSEDATATALVCTDVVITATADGSTARAHRGVLATYSSVFRNALAFDLPGKELAGEAKHDEHGHFRLPLPAKNRHHLSQLMAFLYPCDSRFEQFSNNNIVSYIDLAEEYDMPLMKGAAERWLLAELQHGRVVHMTSRLLSHIKPPRIGTDDIGNTLFQSGPLSTLVRIEMQRPGEAALTVALLERAHTYNLRTFLAKAIDHLTYASLDDILELLAAPGADALPAPVLHKLLQARELRMRRAH
jgi:hypothetical protein